jgi:SAM-dependent methyltransferase
VSGVRARQLANRLAALTPQQPATVLWRAVELDFLLDRDLPSGRGIDIGCGDGRLVRVLREHGVEWRLVGVDPDPEEAALAEESGEYEGVHACSATEIPEPDASFEFAFSNSVLEHIPPLPDVLRETARVLAPDAAFVATVPAATLHSCMGGPGVLAPLLGRDRSAYLERLDDRTAHVNLWDEERWRSELERAGFDRVALTPYLPCSYARRWERMSNWTGGLAYAAAGRSRKPLEVSRAAGIGTGSPVARALRPAAQALVHLALRGYAGPANGEGPHACLLIEARRARPADS